MLPTERDRGRIPSSGTGSAPRVAASRRTGSTNYGRFTTGECAGKQTEPEIEKNPSNTRSAKANGEEEEEEGEGIAMTDQEGWWSRRESNESDRSEQAGAVEKQQMLTDEGQEEVWEQLWQHTSFS
ncbi:hypothetical protein AXG93_4874s1210 [Marchantia polymorpha subsp. ruderalis]|uniref:Uncharacterized protein n=1 Tax=Marchantia polymorpha subsp. ruderalis TaxID=1480154 RepID=A0A176WET5_MARPO|nr:hypothetical protein AXG93_4874s1210 [Marchantia polymorpha subsp. ruderalis]